MLGIPAFFSQVCQVRVTTRLPSPSSWHQRPALSGAAGELFVPPEHGEWEQMGTNGNSQLLPEFIKKYEMN